MRVKEKLATGKRQPAPTGRDPRQGLASTILVAGLGNTLLRDDGFGPEVTRRLQEHDLPGQVHVKDFGTAGCDLAKALHDAYDAVILINAVRRGEKPGTLSVVEPNFEELQQVKSQELLPESHGVSNEVLDLLRRIEADAFKQLIVVGCEPKTVGPEPRTLSRPVTAALDEAVEIVECLIAEMLGESPCLRDS